MPVRKWMSPITLAFANPGAAPGLVEVAIQGIKTIAAEAAITVTLGAANDNAQRLATSQPMCGRVFPQLGLHPFRPYAVGWLGNGPKGVVMNKEQRNSCCSKCWRPRLGASKYTKLPLPVC